MNTTIDLTLPDGWSAREPDERDIARLAQLRADHTRSVIGRGTPDVSLVLSEVIGQGSLTRRQAIALDPDGLARGWAVAHDRAAGRSLIGVVVDPDLSAAVADPVAAGLFAWAGRAVDSFVSLRGLDFTQLDSGAYALDPRQRAWLAQAGYRQVRSWLQMSRPVQALEKVPGVLPEARPGVQIRRVRKHANGVPIGRDVRTVHRMLEESFADHFNSYRESFPEFISRQREDPGHQWDHWWLAFIDGTDTEDGVPAGALVSTVLPPDSSGAQGSYVDYLGVHARARGRGVAKALLHTVIADAAARGRNRVGLEVDADSPTQADGIYRSLGWETSYITESWHQTRARDTDSERSETTP